MLPIFFKTGSSKFVHIGDVTNRGKCCPFSQSMSGCLGVQIQLARDTARRGSCLIYNIYVYIYILFILYIYIYYTVDHLLAFARSSVEA